MYIYIDIYMYIHTYIFKVVTVELLVPKDIINTSRQPLRTVKGKVMQIS